MPKKIFVTRMNEAIFFLHIFLLVGFIYIALRRVPYGLVALCGFQVILANLFVTKQITLFSFTVTPTDAYILGSFLSLNLLQEFYGREEAKKMMQLNLFLLLFFAAMAFVQIIYFPSPFDEMDGAFRSILTPSFRIFFSSLICFIVTQRLDFHLFGFLRKHFSLTKAMFLSLACSQAVDTIGFSLLGLYGLVHSITDIMLVSYLIKMVALATLAPFTKLFQKAMA